MLHFITSYLSPRPKYRRRKPLILINGLAEQPETWFRNEAVWRKHFDVHRPSLVCYDGEVVHRRIQAGLSINVDFLVEQLRTYLESFVQTAPYHLLANSMGGKIAIEFAVRYPKLVDRLVLLCPSGLAEEERLPIVDGVRRSDMQSVVDSVFFDHRTGDRGVLRYYQSQVKEKRWRSGLLRTIRGTMSHNVRDRLGEVTQPTLLVIGREDRIVDPEQSLMAASKLRNGRVVVLPNCGHAPQIEKARQVNRMVLDFLRD